MQQQVVSESTQGAELATTHYKVEEVFQAHNVSRLRIRLETGLKHQIRIQAAAQGRHCWVIVATIQERSDQIKKRRQTYLWTTASGFTLPASVFNIQHKAIPACFTVMCQGTFSNWSSA